MLLYASYFWVLKPILNYGEKLFCLVPRNHEGSILEVGGAEVWRIADTGYLSGTPRKASKEWPSEWFYI